MLIADDVQVNGCIALGTLDGVGALGQILPYGVQARSQVAVPVRTCGGYGAAQIVIGVAVGLYCLFLGLGGRGGCAALQQAIEGGQQQEQRRRDNGCTLGGAYPGTADGAHNGAWCLVAVGAAFMDVGGALLLGVALHIGAAALGTHAVQDILAVDTVIVGALAAQGVGVLGRNGQATFLTPAIDNPPAA